MEATQICMMSANNIHTGLDYYMFDTYFFSHTLLYLLMLYEKGFPCKQRRTAGEECPGNCDLNSMTRNEMRNHTLLLENVRSNQSRRSIKDISFGLRPMDVLGLVGERSGKTNINKMIISERDLSSGRISVKGIDVQDKKENRYHAFKYIGYCPEKIALSQSLREEKT
nr:uncharacterized protein LOC118877214 [Drosophila suzukii]